ncbi:MAG: hypothetical protein MI806_34245 [Minwuiales bacterium]|nr:hypothetical protein [Minwuiales bacterium]
MVAPLPALASGGAGSSFDLAFDLTNVSKIGDTSFGDFGGDFIVNGDPAAGSVLGAFNTGPGLNLLVVGGLVVVGIIAARRLL